MTKTPDWPTADPDKAETPIYDQVKKDLKKAKKEEKK